jgi:hypothetical protein
VTVSELLDGDPGGMPGMYFDSTNQSRDDLTAVRDAETTSLEPFIRYASVTADTLSGFYAFLLEDSLPPKPTDIRKYMIEEMTALWNIRKHLIADLKLCKNDVIIKLLLQIGAGSEVINDCIGELDSIRGTVNETLGNNVRAAWDDLSNEHVSHCPKVSGLVGCGVRFSGGGSRSGGMLIAAS